MSVAEALAAASRVALDLLFPPRCVHCGRDGRLLCVECLASAVRLAGPACAVCAAPIDAGARCRRCARRGRPLERAFAAFEYQGAIRAAVLALKYRDLRSIAPLLGGEMAADERAAAFAPDVIVPAPAHRRSMRARGYNQAELLARSVGKRLRVPVDAGTLRRVVETPRQLQAASREQRLRQAERAFEAGPALAGARVIVVDDVCSTGATLNHCARALRSAGVRAVAGFALAKEL